MKNKKPIIIGIVAVLTIACIAIPTALSTMNNISDDTTSNEVKADSNGTYKVKINDTKPSETALTEKELTELSPVEKQHAEEAANLGQTYDVQEERQTAATTEAAKPEPTKTQIWVPNVVTIVDQEAYDEPVYEDYNVYVCSCGYECSDEASIASHSKSHMKNGESTSHWVETRQKQTGTQHYDAITHTEDHGHYEWR